MRRTILIIILICTSFTIKAQDQTINGNLTITKNLYGKYIHTTDGDATSALFTYPGNHDLYLGSGKDANGNKNDILLYNLSCDGGCNVPNIKLLADNVYTPGTIKTDNHIYGKYIHTTDGDATSALFTYPVNHDLYLGSGKDTSGNKNDIVLYNLSCDSGCNVPNIKLLADNVYTPGNVGIGTMNPDMKLTVKGKIHAEEMLIDLKVPAPDYVFQKDYNLRSIEEVENYIKENSHLPEIPSAKELEEDGVMLLEMNMSLLKKVEELTLYTIQQQKEIERLQSVEKRLEEIEKFLESRKM